MLGLVLKFKRVLKSTVFKAIGVKIGTVQPVHYKHVHVQNNMTF